jgi:hypothetical protein
MYEITYIVVFNGGRLFFRRKVDVNGYEEVRKRIKDDVLLLNTQFHHITVDVRGLLPGGHNPVTR